MAVVLVADDEPAITDLIAQALGANGFDVITAHDGARALELVRSERPDIVMLDVMMPGVDGREVTRRIKADPSLRGIPVVLFSSIDEAQVGWRKAGADAFIQKVFDVFDLPELLRSLLAARSG